MQSIRRRIPGQPEVLAFSEKAAEDGFKNVAVLFRANSEAEAIHARKLLKVLT